MSKKQRKLTTKERLIGLSRVAKITYKASPLAVFVKIAGVVITSILPIITTYFAALTTTALAEAYAGDETAGGRAITYIVATALLGVAVMAWSSLEQYIDQFVRYKIDAAISDQMYNHFLSIDYWRYDDKHTADTFDKSRQFANYFAYIFDSLASVFSSLVQVIAGFVALALISWWLGLIMLAAVIPGVILQLRLSKMRVKHWNTNVETRRQKDMIEFTMLKIEHIAELRLYGLARHLLDMRTKLRDKDEKTRIGFDRKFIPGQLGANILESAAEIAALIYTTLQIIAHAQPIGQLLYVQQITSRALSGSRSFASQLNSIDEDIANLFDYNEFMALPTSAKRSIKLRTLPQTIAVDNISFHYPNSGQTVLSGISLDIRQGEHIAIVGENGAGKSTLIKILLGLYEPTSGSVRIDDKDLSKVQLDSWHEQLGVLQQDFTKYTFASAKDNILLGDVSKKPDEDRLQTAIDSAEARSFLEKLPKGLDNFVHQWIDHDDGTQGVDLSGGQWQRLALARNFYRDSPIIILDEPTSAIDALAESRIFKRLFSMKDKTIIAISHRLTTVQKASMIYVLQDGQIVEHGTHKELVAKQGAYVRLFESQLQ